MKVRRKSEIAEAVQWKPDNKLGQFHAKKGYVNHRVGIDKHGAEYLVTEVGIRIRGGIWIPLAPGDWLVRTGDELTVHPETSFAAHYEPVPEPPARECSSLMETRGHFELRCRLPKHHMGEHSLVPAAFHPAAPSVSGEQPARTYKVLGTEKNFSPRLETEERVPVRHRATIARIPCKCGCQLSYLTIDGTPYTEEDGRYAKIWRGTEVEAKAKMESLRGGE